MTARPPEDLDKVLIAQMALDGVPTRTIQFFLHIWPGLRQMISTPLSQSELSELAEMTPAAAKKHIDRLTSGGYFQREHYRGWRLPAKFPIKEPLYVTISKSLT